MNMVKSFAGALLAVLFLGWPGSAAAIQSGAAQNPLSQQRASCPMPGTQLRGTICVHPTKPNIRHMPECPSGYLFRPSDGNCFSNQKQTPPAKTTSARDQIVAQASCPFPNMYINGRDCMFRNNPSAGYPAKCPPGTALLLGGKCLKSTPPSTSSIRR